MTVDADKVETILRQYWQIPSNLNPVVLQELAFRLHVLVGQKYSHDNLKYQLSIMQTKDLKQDYDDAVCDKIAAELLRLARA